MSSKKSSNIGKQPVPESSPPSFDFTQFQNDPQFPVYVAIAVVGITILIILLSYFLKRGKKGRAVLICGPCEAGKSLFFTQLVHKTFTETFTSMQENVGILDLPESGKKPVNVLDIPGHERIRYKFLDKHKNSAMAIIFLLDSSTITKGIRDATEYLFRILSDPEIHASRVPLLIVCNKQDLTLAKGSSVIERELTKEVGLLRDTHAAGNLSGLSGSVSHVFLGKEGKDFAFADLKAKVDFSEASALNGDNLDKVKAWISSIA